MRPGRGRGEVAARALARSPAARLSRTRRTVIQAAAARPSTSMGMAWIRCPGISRRLAGIAPRLKTISPGR